MIVASPITVLNSRKKTPIMRFIQVLFTYSRSFPTAHKIVGQIQNFPQTIRLHETNPQFTACPKSHYRNTHLIMKNVLIK